MVLSLKAPFPATMSIPLWESLIQPSRQVCLLFHNRSSVAVSSFACHAIVIVGDVVVVVVVHVSERKASRLPERSLEYEARHKELPRNQKAL